MEIDKKPDGRQHSRKKPCAECPFARKTPNDKVYVEGTDKYVNPFRALAQATGPFLLPCHDDPEYLGGGRTENLETIAQCAGAAIYRSNIEIAWKFPAAFHILPEDKEVVFTSPAELVAKFKGISLEEAERLMREIPLDAILAKELADARARYIVPPSGTNG